MKSVGYFLKLKLFKMPKTNRKLKTLSLKEKYEIIKKVQNGECGQTTTALHNVPRNQWRRFFQRTRQNE